MSTQSLAVVTAVTGAAWEARLVTALEHSATGLSIVRRCVDVADLLATAATGQARAVLLSAELRELDRDVIVRLVDSGVAVIGVIGPGDQQAERRLREVGVRRVLSATDEADEIVTAVREGVADLEFGQPSDGAGPPLGRLPLANAAGGLSGETAERASSAGIDGRLIAVWGPTGAPGRTTAAVALASEFAAGGVSTLLADADTYGGSVAQLLGLLDEAPGLAAAARAANAGQLDLPGLAVHARQVLPLLRVLTGLVRADRWPEIRPAALEEVWSLARRLATITVVDCGFCLEQDEEISFDTTAPRRNGATLTTLRQADLVITVGSAEPVGLQRLVRGLADLAEIVPDAARRIIVNRVRRSAVGARPEEQIRDALQRYAGVSAVTFVPYDRPSLDRAVLDGLTLAEAAADSPVRRKFAALAADLTSELAGDLATLNRAGRRPWSRAPRGHRIQQRS